MQYNHNIHHRRSIRLKHYDYRQAGLYFITLCTQNRQCLFGHITHQKMILNTAGNSAQQCWQNIPLHYPQVRLHEYIIMPNHIHGIIETTVGAENFPPLPRPLGQIIRGYKIGVTKWFQKNKNHPIGQSIWQRNYWEHIIRDAGEQKHITDYIINNPTKWEQDKLFIQSQSKY